MDRQRDITVNHEKEEKNRRTAKLKDFLFLWSRFRRIRQLVKKMVKKRNKLCNLGAVPKENHRK